ncbi:hypothetical protein ACH5RR_013258 [Cinchona calisaya]|uniref:Phytochrome chromophore attachment site domain-containing protein n=1 Tax=Cinchona calisaya TaxID=153742 RepID=A0ABD2ZZJ9_9GENT
MSEEASIAQQIQTFSVIAALRVKVTAFKGIWGVGNHVVESNLDSFEESGKPFYGILHRNDVKIVMDLEPARSDDPTFSIVGAVQLQKFFVRAILHLQSLPGSDIKLLCDTVVESVRELAGYDRVIVYKFHKDKRGEASRFLLKQNRVRMIVDCHATPVQYMANMGSIASLSLAIIINGNEEDGVGEPNYMRLWGLVVGHHTSAWCIPFPLRYACEFLMQAFGLELNMELQLALQLSEKHVLRTQTLLCDMILQDSPTGIVTQSPSIMNLVKCDGAALYYHAKYYTLELCADSLADVGYPRVASLGDTVCGMAVTYITSRDFLCWFRSYTAKEVKWGAAKHHPEDKDNGKRMHAYSLFKAFLEVVKSQSLPWESAEMDTIHSL